jgi:hypothetical protein
MRRLSSIVALTGVAVAATLFTTGQASAATSCPSRTVCFFNGPNGGGGIHTIPSGSRDPWFGNAGHNDAASSWVNNTSLTYCWYYDINYGGKALSMPPSNDTARNMAIVDRGKASSAQPCDV